MRQRPETFQSPRAHRLSRFQNPLPPPPKTRLPRASDRALHNRPVSSGPDQLSGQPLVSQGRPPQCLDLFPEKQVGYLITHVGLGLGRGHHLGRSTCHPARHDAMPVDTTLLLFRNRLNPPCLYFWLIHFSSLVRFSVPTSHPY